ncbi:hypothetical protein J2852_003430 [Azospirillum soli]|nr:hypothetical protein [Azospirillum soli]
MQAPGSYIRMTWGLGTPIDGNVTVLAAMVRPGMA